MTNARVQTQSPALTLALKQAAGAQTEGFSLRDSPRRRGKQGDGSSPDASEFRIRLIPTGPCRRLATDCCCALPLGRCVRLNDVVSGSCCSFVRSILSRRPRPVLWDQRVQFKELQSLLLSVYFTRWSFCRNILYIYSHLSPPPPILYNFTISNCNK